MLVEQQSMEGETMSTKMMSKASIMAYLHQLECDEKASATIEKYRHDINLFYEFLPDEKVLTKEDAIRYKQYLIEKGMLQRVSIQCW